MNLTDKIAVVTGASKGIGLAISQAFADAGAYVIAGARHNSPELQALEAAGSATFVAADLSTPRGPDGAGRRGRRAGRRRHPGQQRRRGGAAIRRHPVGHRRGVGGVAGAELPGRGAHHPRGHPADARPRRRHDRHDRLGERLRCRTGTSSTTPPPRPRWPTSPRVCRRSSAPRGFASTPSARARCRRELWLGENGVAAKFAVGQRRHRRRRGGLGDRRARRPVASPPRRRSPTSRSSWPATAPPTSPAPTSASTAATSPRSECTTREEQPMSTKQDSRHLHPRPLDPLAAPGSRGWTCSPNGLRRVARPAGPAMPTPSQAPAPTPTRSTTSGSPRSSTTTPSLDRRRHGAPSRSSSGTPSAGSSPRSCSPTASPPRPSRSTRRPIKGVKALPFSQLRSALPGAGQPGQQEAHRVADRQAVPLRLRQHAHRGGVRRAARASGPSRARAGRCSRTRRRTSPRTPRRGRHPPRRSAGRCC